MSEKNYKLNKLSFPDPQKSLNRILTTPSLHLTDDVLHTTVESGQDTDDYWGSGIKYNYNSFLGRGDRDKNSRVFSFLFFRFA
jgi:hypothetical protein